MTWKKFLKNKVKLFYLVSILLISIFIITSIRGCSKRETVGTVLEKIEKSKRIGEILKNEYERLKSNLHKTN